MTAYFLANGNIKIVLSERNTQDISKMNSNVSLNDGIKLDNGYRYVFSEEVQTTISQLWISHPDSEYLLCVDGDIFFDKNEEANSWKDGDSYVVADKVLAKYEGGKDYVTSPLCDGVVTIHNHPNIGCSTQLGTADSMAAKKFFSNGGLLFMIQCEENSFEMYTRNDLYNGEIVIIN